MKRPTGPISFTKRNINALKPPTDGKDRFHVRDSGQAGLTLSVFKTGLKVFYYYAKIRGRADRIKIGAYPDLSVEQARTKAKSYAGQVADGKDPREKRSKLKKSPTIGELFADFLEHYDKVHCRERTWKEDERLYRLHLKRWQHLKATNIATSDVITLHSKIGKTTPVLANRVVALLSRLYTWAETTNKDWSYANPCKKKGVKRFAETERERFLSIDEFRRYWNAIDSEPDIPEDGDPEKTSQTIRDFFKILTLTGARKSNVLAMRWAHINLEQCLWTVPASEAKAKKSLRIPLVPQAVEILKERDDSKEYVFPSRGKGGHLLDPRTGWKRLLKRAKLSNVTMHDIRRNLGSWMASGGSTELVIGKVLGHTDPTATRIYARLMDSAVRDGMADATQRMLIAADGSEVIDSEGKSND